MKPPQELKDLYSKIAQTPIEKKIVSTTYDSPALGEVDNDHEEFNKLIDLITTWRKLLATPGNLSASSAQIRTEAKFLIKVFPQLTLDQIAWMQELYTHRLLPMIYPEWVYFNVDFIGKVVRAFGAYKDLHSQRMTKFVEKMLEEPKVTPKMNRDAMQFMIQEVYKQLNGGFGRTVLMLQDVFEYLCRTGQLAKVAQNSTDARKYATDKFNIVRKTSYGDGRTMSLRELLTGPSINRKDQDKVLAEFQQEYCVSQYLKQKPLEDVLKNVRIEHFMHRNQAHA